MNIERFSDVVQRCAQEGNLSAHNRFAGLVGGVWFTALAAVALLCSENAVSRELPPDPMRSVMWADMAELYFPDGPIVFDQRVQLLAPASAENQMMVPLTIDARALARDSAIETIVLVADLNPIQKAVAFTPLAAEPFLGLEIKLEQASPVRVGVKTTDGVWHMNGRIVDAAGGGCSSPAAAHGGSNWMKTLGQTQVLARRERPDQVRLRLRMKHPMDTGLADGIPVFHLTELEVSEAGAALARLELYEPISEDPSLTLIVGVDAESEQLDVAARDTEGNRFGYQVPLLLMSSR